MSAFTTESDDDFLAQDAEGTEKSLLIRVPNFGSATFERRGLEAGTTLNPSESLTSFLRIGKFDWADETDRSKELLGYIHEAGGPGDPSIFDNTLPAASGGADWRDTAPPFLARTEDQANYAGNRDVFFLDDVRIHDVDIQADLLTEFKAAAAKMRLAEAMPETNDDEKKARQAAIQAAQKQLTAAHIRGHGLTRLQRQNESRKLYSRGGWRDHSDGNRISTTYGDKVEVVRGNYKMVVMGRQDDPGEAMGWETTGDHVVDYAPGTMPGAGYWLEFVPDYKHTDSSGAKHCGVWLLVNTTENVYEYARFAGNFREERWGDVLETYVGSAFPPASSVASLRYSTAIAGSTAGTTGHEPPTRLAGRSYDLPKYVKAREEASARRAFDLAVKAWEDGGRVGPKPGIENFTATGERSLVPGWAFDNQDQIRSNPHIIEKTWAVRIDSHRGSAECRVPDIYEETWATTIDTKTRAAHITDTVGASDDRADDVTSKVYAKRVDNLTDVDGGVFTSTLATAIMEAKTSKSVIWETKTAPNVGEVVTGTKLSVGVGVAVELFLGAKFGIELSGGVTLTLLGAKEITIPDKEELRLKKIETSLKDSAARLESTISCLKNTFAALENDELSLTFRAIALSMSFGI